MHCLRGPAQRWRSVGVRPPRRRGAPPRAEPNGGGPPGGGGQQPPPPPSPALPPLGELWTSLLSVASPYWQDPAESGGARLRLGGVVALSLATTAASVGFNFLGRDFFNAIAAKDEPAFHSLLLAYLGAIAGAVPLFVLRDYQQSLLALRWREWLTERYLGLYLGDRAFFRLAADGSVDNPDQRLNADVGAFTGAALGLALTLFGAAVDLASFSGILASIYPPLFGVLVLYAAGGTALSVRIGAPLVGLNFAQEAREADFRYALVRVRENAESVAFYGGERAERAALSARFAAAVANLKDLLLASRNLSAFTSGYRYLIGVLPAALVAPLYFRGEIEFGVINQSSSAFGHVLADVSLVVYQLDGLAGFAATLQRVAGFERALGPAPQPPSALRLGPLPPGSPPGLLLAVDGLTLAPPAPPAAAAAAAGAAAAADAAQPPPPLVRGLSLRLFAGRPLLVTGPSGAGKTSLLRALAGLWTAGEGAVAMAGVAQPGAAAAAAAGADGPGGGGAVGAAAAGPWDGDADDAAPFFVPQRPYLPLGSLRAQLLYPRWGSGGDAGDHPGAAEPGGGGNGGCAPAPARRRSRRPPPSDAALLAALAAVGLAGLPSRSSSQSQSQSQPQSPAAAAAAAGLDGACAAAAGWGAQLSLGEQQRLAFARLLLAAPPLALLDEATSALDERAEAACYAALAAAGVTALSVGHRASLRAFHADELALDGEGGWALAPIPRPGGGGGGGGGDAGGGAAAQPARGARRAEAAPAA